MRQTNREEDDDGDTPVLLGERPRNQNPLRMLELLVKGFCPTIIRDRMEEIHEEKRSNQETDDESLPNAVTATPTAKRRNTETCGRRPRKPPQQQPLRPPHMQPEPHPMPDLSSMDDSFTTTDKHYFEIGERPPSDVIGLSKKLWESFCQNPYDDNRNNKTHTSSHHPPLHRGFCRILTDQLCLHHNNMDNGDDEATPDGEECSVDSDDASYSSSLDVDLSPQSASTTLQGTTSNRNGEEMPYKAALHGAEDDTDSESDSEGEEEDEEPQPLAEFLYVNRSKRRIRRLQVLVSTFLAVYTTFVLVQKLDTVHDKSFHFAVKRKETSATSVGPTGFSSIFSVSKTKEGIEEGQEAAVHMDMDVMELVAPVIPSMREKIQATLASPFGEAFVLHLQEESTLPKYYN